jgi:hypothetical protein
MLVWLRSQSALILTSWHLWHQLHYPIDNPIFKRTQRHNRQLYTAINISYVVFLTGIVTVFGTAFVFTVLGSTIIIVMPLILILFSSSYVMVWVYRVALIIAIERENQTLDMLSVSPMGQLYVKWIICIATLHHSDILSWIDLSRRIIIGMTLTVFIMALCVTTAQMSQVDGSQMLGFVLSMLIFTSVIYIEHVQSTIIGCLVAMWMPEIIPVRIDATIGSILVYIMLQVVTYFAGLYLAVVLQSGGNLDTNTLFNPEQITLSLMMFVLVREAIITILWRMLAYQSNANPNVLRMFDLSDSV